MPLVCAKYDNNYIQCTEDITNISSWITLDKQYKSFAISAGGFYGIDINNNLWYSKLYTDSPYKINNPYSITYITFDSKSYNLYGFNDNSHKVYYTTQIGAQDPIWVVIASLGGMDERFHQIITSNNFLFTLKKNGNMYISNNRRIKGTSELITMDGINDIFCYGGFQLARGKGVFACNDFKNKIIRDLSFGINLKFVKPSNGKFYAINARVDDNLIYVINNDNITYNPTNWTTYNIPKLKIQPSKLIEIIVDLYEIDKTSINLKNATTQINKNLETIKELQNEFNSIESEINEINSKISSNETYTKNQIDIYKTSKKTYEKIKLDAENIINAYTE